MTKHKHYYAIRAFADGWKIECISLETKKWVFVERPIFNEDVAYRVVPDENGWLPWYGGECQAEPDTMVEIWFYNCIVRGRGKVSEYDWDSNQIIAYRILKEADPYAELKAAAEDPNKEIAIKGHEVTLGWHSGKYWKFDCPVEDYVVRDKPKKIKLLAWVEANGDINWRKEGYEYGPYWARIWKRAPSEDKEVEVEE